MRKKADGSYVEIPFIVTGRGFIYSGLYDAIAPEDPLPESEGIVFLKPNAFEGEWAVPGWEPAIEDSFFNSEYKDFYGVWTGDYNRRLIYGIR